MTEAPERIWATTYHLTSTKGFWYNEPITPNRPENQGVEYVRADLAQPVAVKVKPLVFVPSKSAIHPRWSTAASCFGGYAVSEEPWKNGLYPLTIPGHDTKWCVTLEAAFDTAQADYEARVLAAIEPAPAPTLAEALRLPKIAALVEAVEEISRQKKTNEMDTEYDVEVADFEGGYDACIDRARAARRKLEGGEP